MPFRTITLLLLLSAATLSAQEGKENAEFKLAVGLYNDKMYDLALDQFKNFIAAYPSSQQGIDARFYLGETQLRLKRYDEARVTFQNFALTYTDHPKAPLAWLRTGDAFEGLGNLREAALACERVKVFNTKSPLVPEALLRAGRLFRRAGDRESARRDLQGVAQDYPASSSVPAARLALGELYADDGDLILAEREIRRVSESEAPDSLRVTALLALGELRFSMCLFDDAETSFRKVTAVQPASAAALDASYQLGLLALNGRDFAGALGQFRKVIDDKDADDTLRERAFVNAGKAYARKGDLARAQEMFEEAAREFPNSPNSALTLILAAAAAGKNRQPDHALGILQKLIAGPHTSDRALALSLAAFTAEHAANYTDAERYFVQFADEYPDMWPSSGYLMEAAHIAETMFRGYRKAILLYERVLQQYPRSIQVTLAMKQSAACRQQLGDIDGAIRTYEDLQTRYPGNKFAESVDTAIAFLRTHLLKNPEGAIGTLAHVISGQRSGAPAAELSLEMARTYFNDLRDYASAADEYAKALSAGGLTGTNAEEAAYARALSVDRLSDIDSSRTAEAIGLYGEFVARYPASARTDSAAWNSYLLRLHGQGSGQMALLAKEFLAQHPSSAFRAQALLHLGTASADLHDTVVAFGTLRSLAREFAGSPEARLGLIVKGRLHRSLGEEDSALATWNIVVAGHARDRAAEIALVSLAGLCRQYNFYEKSVRYLEQLRETFWYTEDGWFARDALPEAYMGAERLDTAIGLLKSLPPEDEVAAFSGNPLIEGGSVRTAQIGFAYQQQGDRLKATKYFTSYLLVERKGFEAARTFYALGAFARSAGEKAIASAYFKEAAALGSGVLGEVNSSEIADLLFQSEEYADAARQYAELAKKNGGTAQTRRVRSLQIVATLRSGKIPEGLALVEDYTKAYGDSSMPEFEYEIGSAYYKAENYPEAKKAFEKLAGDYGDTRFGPWGKYYLAKLLETSNKLDEAAKKYMDLLEKYPSSDVTPRILLSLGNMHFNAERYDRAIAYYKQIAAAPEKAGEVLSFALSNLIEAYESQKLYDDAVRTTRQFIDKFPSDENIIDKKIKLGTLLTKSGYYDQAVAQFQKVLGEAGSMLEAEIRYDIGEAYYYKGDYQQAILEFLKVPYLVSRQGKVNWTATAFYMAGQSYEKMSKFDEAIGMYRQVVERPGIDATFKAAAQKEIDRVKGIKKDSQ